MTRQEVESLFKRRLEVQNSHDIPAMVALYTDDCVLESPTAGTPVRGAAGIENVHRAWMTGFPDVVFTSKELLIDGDRVAQIMEAQARTRRVHGPRADRKGVPDADCSSAPSRTGRFSTSGASTTSPVC
jgi:ketosteroid isomerase-like protein